MLIETILFQSTPPVWAETLLFNPLLKIIEISIHSARVGGDSKRNHFFVS